jgi:phosphomethylpyrimidine synthase
VKNKGNKMNYKTQMEAARKGIITEEIKTVAANEKIDILDLMKKMSDGKIVIPANKNHKKLQVRGIGEGLKTKINVNLGVSNDCCNTDIEYKKALLAEKLDADAVMDLSCYGETRVFRKKLIADISLPLGTVPMYDTMIYHNKELEELTAKDFLESARCHAEDGIDFLTIHAGLNRKTAERLNRNKRLTNIVSRGGSILYSWMYHTGNENPFYEYFDELLEICREFDVTLSLGDGCRPGCIADATDSVQLEELITLGELTKRAWQKDVQIIIEGPGHVPLKEIEANVLLEKKLCYGAPFYVLGPLVTDIAPGYDHIVGAIGGAVAASKGADFLCYLTPAEHLKLPSLEDVYEGIIASKIAAHSADLAKGVIGADKLDYRISKGRAELDWDAIIKSSIDPIKAKKYREESMPEDKSTCTMCGKLCAIKNMNNTRVEETELVVAGE